jgi:D-serine deaminase-like pyridoxal phosphate-dependent protein|tara:strand:- start:1921 stop:3072 length:1152 start_codon:yes stop_codon:yes gene_type:complete
MRLNQVQTPALILDRQRLLANAKAMTALTKTRGLNLRPHMKTCKSVDVARIALKENFGGITVATLNEAEYFSSHGIQDILYGVCVTPDKLSWIAELQRKGARMIVITDSLAVAKVLADWKPDINVKLKVLIEVDCGEHRTGVVPDDPTLLEIANCIHDASHVELAGVMTHAGHSYSCDSVAQIAGVSEQERMAAVKAASMLRRNGFPCENVSVGSTPTALHAVSAEGITEIRAGVYLFNDLFQTEVFSCEIADIAVSVLATVISHNKSQDKILIDAGGLALSKDRSTASTKRDSGYGQLTDMKGRPLGRDLFVSGTHQEHGEISVVDALSFDLLPIGSRVRVLPNHACMTSAMHDAYHVVDGESDVISHIWRRTNGWQSVDFD